jgi:hypothetical protein
MFDLYLYKFHKKNLSNFYSMDEYSYAELLTVQIEIMKSPAPFLTKSLFAAIKSFTITSLSAFRLKNMGHFSDRVPNRRI